MYNSVILPHINYGILVWGHQAHRIFKLQKKAIRTITLSKYNAHTYPIYIALKFLKLDDMYKLQQFYFKLINKLLPEYFNHISYTHNFKIHQCYTHGRNNLFIPRTTHEFATKYIRHNITILLTILKKQFYSQTIWFIH